MSQPAKTTRGWVNRSVTVDAHDLFTLCQLARQDLDRYNAHTRALVTRLQLEARVVLADAEGWCFSLQEGQARVQVTLGAWRAESVEDRDTETAALLALRVGQSAHFGRKDEPDLVFTRIA